MSDLATRPSAILRRTEELPFVDAGNGTRLQPMQVDLAVGLWTLRTTFEAGTTIRTHRHTGAVHAFTITGRWHYLEYPDDVNLSGSHLFEPGRVRPGRAASGGGQAGLIEHEGEHEGLVAPGAVAARRAGMAGSHLRLQQERAARCPRP